ncbi:vWA domain-containing protein [Paenibacillus radicis (ex Xue et al. 2023)]|uniref:VWA domain-containing protein n=1 Tax=Paenibacillus radicis (ex Xue et al. 2023) TaxID=2972489 RepID=A0ABT1YQL6_9BACL|nr:BatA and WFA domain-containing protein [Paenibacillus radicis (ex Xue et al. 2023)]MCR8635477.1 VWA domain-containing protein [Paenibacillus radicis (ex Xue et al. 2023)]
MQFQSLLSLWFGLTLPVIVLMYILKRKYIDTIVPSHLLWNRVLRNLEANTPWQKLRNNLLLLLQLLIAALLVLALMQPFIWSSGGAKNHVVVVLDRSFSMETLTSAKGENGQLLSRLEQAKQDIAQLVKKDASSSAITLITMGGQPDVLVSREIKRDAIQAALNEVTPYYGKTAYKETLSLAAALTQDDKDSEIRVYTDGQWTDSTAGLSFRVPVKVIRAGQAGESVENVRVVQFGVKPSGVMGTSAISNGSPGTEGSPTSTSTNGSTGGASNASTSSTNGVELIHAVAMLKNEGSNKQEFDIELYSGSSLGDVRHESLQPGEQKTFYFDKLQSADYYKLTVNIKDALAADNQAFAFLPGERTKKVLLVTEGNVFLEKALQLSHAEVTKVQTGGAGPLTPPRSGVDLVVLDSVKAADIADKAWQELLEQKPVWYIHTPAQMAEVNAPAAEYQIIDHPVTQYIRLQDTHIAKLQKQEAVSWGKAVISLGSQPIVYAGSDKGQPRLLFAFDLHQSDLPLRSEFPVLVQNAVEWLGSRQAFSLGRAVAGERIDIPLSGKTTSAEWLPLDIVGDPLPVIAAEKAEGSVTSSQTVPNRPGLYQFVEHAAAGAGAGSSSADRKTYLEVTADPRETAVMPQQEPVFAAQGSAAANGGTQIQPQTNGGSNAASDQSTQPSSAGDEVGSQGKAANAGTNDHNGQSLYSLVRWAVLLVTILMLVEWGVYRRGTSI